MNDIFPAILTLLGGTVGGYITFAGAHRLIDAGITRKENLGEIKKSSVMGIGIATIVRVFLFLAVLGVVAKGAVTLDSSNPAADAFRLGAGEIGYRFFGLVLLAAAITSIVGCAYTSVSFLKTFHSSIEKNEKWYIVGFIAVCTVVMAVIGQPAVLLVLAGALNGLILPITLGVCLIASQKKSIMGQDYRHPVWLLLWDPGGIVGWGSPPAAYLWHHIGCPKAGGDSFLQESPGTTELWKKQRFYTAGDSSVLIEFGKEISPEINGADHCPGPSDERAAHRGGGGHDPRLLQSADQL